MSPTVEIVDLTKKIDDSLKERVLDPNRPVKDFDDVLELGMYNSYELGEYDDFRFLEGMKNVEVKLTETPEFKKNAMQIDLLRRELEDGVNNNPTFQSLVVGQNKLREQALQLLPPVPDGDTTEWMQRVHDITQNHQQYHIEEQERMQVEVVKSERDMHSAELERTALLLKKIDAVEVSDWYKQHEKDIQQHIVRNKTKPPTGESEDTKQMKAHLVELFEQYKSVKVGSTYVEDEGEIDNRKPRYSDAECYNLIQANYYPKLKISTIDEYIRKHKK